MREALLLRGEARLHALDDAVHDGRSPRLARARQDTLAVQRLGDLGEAHPAVSAVSAPKLEDSPEDGLFGWRRPESLTPLATAVTAPNALASGSQLEDRDAAVEFGDGAENLSDESPRRIVVRCRQFDAFGIKDLDAALAQL